MKIKIVKPPVLDVGWLMRSPQSDIWILYNSLIQNFSKESVSMKDFSFYFYDNYYLNLRLKTNFIDTYFYRHQDIINFIKWDLKDLNLINSIQSLYNSIKEHFIWNDYVIIPLTVYEQSPIEYFFSWLLFWYLLKKENPNTKLIFVWEYLSHYVKFLVQEFNFIDGVILRWDKNAVIKIINNFEIINSNVQIDNAIYRIQESLIFPSKEYDNDIWDDLIPDYSWFDFEVHKMQDWKLVMSYEFWEWCRSNCFYCYNIHKWWKFHTKSIDKIVSELKIITSKYNTYLFNFNDSEINYSNDFLNKLASTIVKEKLKIFWTALIIPKELPKELLDLLFTAWCRQLRFWIESWSQRILDIIWKWTNVEEIQYIIKNCKEIWISVYSTFIVDLPQENNNDIKLSMEFIYKNKLYFDNISICAYNTHIWNFDNKYLKYLLWKSDFSFCRTKRTSYKKILLRNFCDKLWLYNIDVINFLRNNF